MRCVVKINLLPTPVFAIPLCINSILQIDVQCNSEEEAERASALVRSALLSFGPSAAGSLHLQEQPGDVIVLAGKADEGVNGGAEARQRGGGGFGVSGAQKTEQAIFAKFLAAVVHSLDHAVGIDDEQVTRRHGD